MRSAIIFAILAIALAHPPRLVEVAKKVNSLHTTWIANEAIPTRDYSKYIGALKGQKLPVKNIAVRKDLPEDRKSTRLNSSHSSQSRMPSSA